MAYASQKASGWFQMATLKVNYYHGLKELDSKYIRIQNKLSNPTNNLWGGKNKNGMKLLFITK